MASTTTTTIPNLSRAGSDQSPHSSKETGLASAEWEGEESENEYSDENPEWEGAIPKDLLPIRAAGSGAFGKVVYCIPRGSLKDYADITKQPSHLPMSLKGQVCVVKVHGTRTNAHMAWREASILRFLQESDGYPRYNISSLIGCDMQTDGLSSMTIEATHGPTLSEFVGTSLTRSGRNWLSREFVWHVFLQLGKAMRFIHSMKVSHNDAFLDNVMLDPQRQTFPGLPNVVLIDFGFAHHIDTERNNPYNTTEISTTPESMDVQMGRDNVDFLDVVSTLCDFVCNDESEEWLSFVNLLQEYELRLEDDEVSDDEKSGLLDYFFSRYEGVAIAERVQMHEMDKKKMMDHLYATSRGLSDKEIRNAIVAELEKA
ncbi:kinase-like protein [Lophium mytilinum]|uniref:Kinase-like protein n=1 Tax=Lophium mytilinum TaxID=390894 RepID=A0A6A6QGG0_9PEZI|nr:kinase-like protein [Lophium mytilinum]